jgi:histidinol-phosphatase (PHP family)
MRFDQHLHSRHSFDSRADPEANVRRAIELGLNGLTFTEHFDTHPVEWPLCCYDDARYSDDIARLRQRYGDRLFIGKGIEICYQPQNEGLILDHLERYKFDLVLLSVHWTPRGAIHDRNCWEDIAPAAATRLYLETVLEAARWADRLAEKRGRVFDVLGHIDLIRRYLHRYFNHYDPAEGADPTDEILRACLAADLIPEVNTSTIRSGHGRLMPDAPVVARYAELGGQAMVLGSDAHKPEHIAADFDAAVAMLQDNGIRRQAVFRGRCRSLEPLT